MALDFDMLADGEGQQHVGEFLFAGLAFRHHFEHPRVTRPLSRVCTRKPPATERQVRVGASGSGSPPAVSRRRFFFAARMRRASSSASGAMITSVKIFEISSAASPSSVWLKREHAAKGRNAVAGQGLADRRLSGLFPGPRRRDWHA